MKAIVSTWDKYPKYSLTTDGLTQSMLSVAMQCPRKLWFFLNRLKNPVSQKNYAFGTLMHNIIEQMYTGTIKTDEQVLEYIDLLEDSDTKKTALAAALATAYLKQHSKELKAHTYHCEKSFNMDYVSTKHVCKLRGKRDLYFIKNKSEVWLMEHKFWSQINPEQMVSTLSYDFQVLFYCWTYWKEKGKMPTGIIYNIVRKPQNKMKDEGDPVEFQERVYSAIMEKPEYYFYRVPISITPESMARFEKDFHAKLDYMKYLLNTDIFRNEFSCFSHYTCDYHDACFSKNIKLLMQDKTLFTELEE